jgi:acetyltransferase-like isoleucine patch superfamily enzyme
MRRKVKRSFSFILTSDYRAIAVLRRHLRRVRSHALLSSQFGTRLDALVVVLGPPEVHGTGRISIGRNPFPFPFMYLETQDAGSIDIGDDVVISSGVHIVSRARLRIGECTMI